MSRLCPKSPKESIKFIYLKSEAPNIEQSHFTQLCWTPITSYGLVKQCQDHPIVKYSEVSSNNSVREGSDAISQSGSDILRTFGTNPGKL